MTEISKENIVDMLVECGRILDAQEVEADDRWLLVNPRVFKTMRHAIGMLGGAPRRRGARGRKRALCKARKLVKKFWNPVDKETLMVGEVGTIDGFRMVVR